MNRVGALLILSLVTSCSLKKSNKLFEERKPEETGITFQNTVVQSGENNVLNYPYYFNGGGVAVGDINNDGLIDIYFTGNQVSNRLYLNKGDFKFEDITDKAGVAAIQGWKTGVTLVDINSDGWLDIYVCRSAMGDPALRRNLLFINNHNLTFTERAHEYGIDDDAYSTQSAFFDYDKDGDQDLFLLNHSLPQYAGFNRLLVKNKQQRGDKFGSKLYQNNDGHFSDVSDDAGIINNVLSFGLGVAVSDFDQDGWLDLYISNDFNEEDYLYHNNRNGTFTNVIKEATGHVSLFSMGSDAADINNDGLADIITLDMLPESNERIKLSSGDDNYDKYQLLVKAGFHHQTMRNMLQVNNGDGTFSEVGQLAGVSGTDWSWTPLFADFDGDGNKDLFITNGYEKDYTNMQFLKFTVDEQLKARQTGTQLDVKMILEQMPSINSGNYLFKNNGDLTFSNETEQWGISIKHKSNGAAYADLDNDGDLDLIANTMNEPAAVYENHASTESRHFLKVDLGKKNQGVNLVGTKVYMYAKNKIQYQEFQVSRGFQSGIYAPLTFGLDSGKTVDSVRIIWPDNKTQLVFDVVADQVCEPVYTDASKIFAYQKKKDGLFRKMASDIQWKHQPLDTNDFKRQLLLPKPFSYSGPHLAKGDVNHDGLDDIYLCGAKHQGGSLWVQGKNTSFHEKRTDAFLGNKNYQDEDALFFDADRDGDLDLYVVSGGYAANENDASLQDRLYLNDGKGNFTQSVNSLPNESLAGSCVTSLDVDHDGDLDLFVGSRLIPGRYPVAPESMLLINDGRGHFTNEINAIAPSLKSAGMITDAVAVDMNSDSFTDLIVVGEWMPVKMLINREGALKDESAQWISSPASGWWNCLLADDFDKDGDIDLVAGNEGLNNPFQVSGARPATLDYKDFNNDGQVDPFFCYYIQGKSYPYASRDEALGQVNVLRKRFPDYISYANATMETIFTKEELQGTHHLKADNLKSTYFENTGKNLIAHDLPKEALFSPLYALAVADVDQDGDNDLITAGNDTNVRVRRGKSDANRGIVLLNDGKGIFTYLPNSKSGLSISGDVRSIVTLKDRLLFGVNGDSLICYGRRKQKHE